VGYNKKWTGLLTWCRESFLKNWTMTGILTNCVLRWSYLWWWEQDLWQPRRERFCFLHKEKEMGGGGVLLVITLISPTDSMMEISESNFVRNIDMPDLLTILTKEYLPNFFFYSWIPLVIPSVFTVGDFSFNYYRWKHQRTWFFISKYYCNLLILFFIYIFIGI
jgi:hypothetical protein